MERPFRDGASGCSNEARGIYVVAAHRSNPARSRTLRGENQSGNRLTLRHEIPADRIFGGPVSGARTILHLPSDSATSRRVEATIFLYSDNLSRNDHIGVCGDAPLTRRRFL